MGHHQAALARNEEGSTTALGVLTQMLGDRVERGTAIREQHGHTTTWLINQPPDAVIFPKTTEEVQDIVRVCATHRVPIIPFGTGTSRISTLPRFLSDRMEMMRSAAWIDEGESSSASEMRQPV